VGKNIHWQTANESAVDKSLATAKALDQPDGEYNHTKRLCNTVEAGCEELC